MGSGIVLQQLVPGQINAVVAQEGAATEYPWTEGMYTDSLDAGYWIGALVEQDAILGLAVVTSAVGEAHLLNMWVDLHRQGQGLGRKVLQAVIAHAIDTDASHLFLEVRVGNGRARNLYESVGFSEIGLRKDYYPGALGREDAVCMALNLSKPRRES